MRRVPSYRRSWCSTDLRSSKSSELSVDRPSLDGPAEWKGEKEHGVAELISGLLTMVLHDEIGFRGAVSCRVRLGGTWRRVEVGR